VSEWVWARVRALARVDWVKTRRRHIRQ
jgi:hypothetical protein